jgi:hypothetical protein
MYVHTSTSTVQYSMYAAYVLELRTILMAICSSSTGMYCTCPLFRDLWFCAIPTFDCPCSLIQPMPPRRSQPLPTFPISYLGHRNRSWSLSNVISPNYITFLEIDFRISLPHLTQTPTILQISIFYTTLLLLYFYFG